ncbi:acyltransferase [Sphaerisporangium rufum]|uniref:Acyltransferase n=1 Tax=Sphaerisporangium rufum TaxID=1381558 RepID=A0A919R5Z7_9ACTN|nr:acyltransferase family protein [Sphaerisporangium rufum]GII80312.1 acyltransferase [Sphaerisporangium rufum]
MPALLDRPSPSPRAGAAGGGRPRPAPPAPGRDRFIDLLRLFGIAVVVLEHWSIPVLSYDGGRIATGNAYAAPGAFALTWLGQCMPLVFFAGGAANAISHRAHLERGGTGPAWLAGRVRRLAWPVLPLAAVWVPLPHLLLALGLPAQPVRTAAGLAGQLLWFLAVYLLAVALTPWLRRLGDRYGARVPVALALAAALVDVVRFTGPEAAGYLNVAFVWLAVHQLGFMYAGGRLGGHRALAAGGLGAAVLLVAFGPYPAGMIGLPGEPSNVAPPTLALLAVAAGQIGVAMLLRPRLVRLAATPLAGRLLAWAGPRMMTVYLWHMSALFVVAGVVVVGLGAGTPAPGSAGWLAGWPLWLGALALVARPLVRWFARFEAPPRVAPGAAPGRGRVLAATGLAGAGLLALTAFGFVPGVAPVLGAGAVLAGTALATPRRRRVRAGAQAGAQAAAQPAASQT